MSRWDIFRWRTLAGGRWCPVGTVQRRPRRQPRLPDWAVRSSVVTAAFSCHPAPSVCRPSFSPAGSVSAGRSPLGSCAISDGGGTRMCAGRWLAAQLLGSHLLGALPFGKSASLFP